MSDGWVLNDHGMHFDVTKSIQDLKTLGILNKDKWLFLARHFKKAGQLERCEICYVGARYCDVKDKDLMREWLAVYTLNRGIEGHSKNQLLDAANVVNEGMFDVVNAGNERLLQELQHVLFILEKPDERGN